MLILYFEFSLIFNFNGRNLTILKLQVQFFPGSFQLFCYYLIYLYILDSTQIIFHYLICLFFQVQFNFFVIIQLLIFSRCNSTYLLLSHLFIFFRCNSTCSEELQLYLVLRDITNNLLKVCFLIKVVESIFICYRFIIKKKLFLSKSMEIRM